MLAIADYYVDTSRPSTPGNYFYYFTFTYTFHTPYSTREKLVIVKFQKYCFCIGCDISTGDILDEIETKAKPEINDVTDDWDW